MAIDTASPRSRRALLGAAIGAIGATVASAFGRPSPIRAATGDFVVLGQTNGATATTTILTDAQKGLVVESSDFTGWGLVGHASSSGSGATNGVYGLSDSPNGVGVAGRTTSTSGATNGLYGESSSNGGTGVFGRATQGNGTTNGVYGRSDSSAGTGVNGYASFSSGTTNGVYGRSDSSAGIGVNGYAHAGSGLTSGVYGRSDSTAGTGVSGLVTAPSGSTVGVLGLSQSPSGIGVYGHNTAATTVENYGVLGVSQSTLGRGVYGDSLSTTTGTGVWGQGRGASAAGVRGYAWDGDAASGKFGTGVLGSSGSHAFPPPTPRADTGVMGITPTGTGVYGTTTSGIGVHGQGSGASSIGVYGHNTAATTVENYGVLGVSQSTLGRGVYGDSLSTTTGTGVWGQGRGASAAGVRGYAWDGDAASGKFGTGVLGSSGSHAFPPPTPRADTGVMGITPTGTGVYGTTTSGIGVLATASTGFALRTIGRLKVDKASGVATIAAANATVLVNPGLDVTTTSFVLLTPRASLGGRDLWYTVDTVANTFTIRVSSAVAANLAIGWLLLG